MRPRVVSFAAAIAAVLAACGDPAGPVTHQEQFEVFWSAMDRHYPYFDHKRVNWDSARASAETRALSATSQYALIRALADAAAPLRDAHLGFELVQDGYTFRVSSYSLNPLRSNYSEGLAVPTLQATFRSVRAGWEWASLGGRVGYLAIYSWSAPFSVAAFDTEFERFRNDTALIVDVRMNPGGNDALAYQVAGRFAAQPVIAEYTQQRSGPGHADLSPAQARLLQPRGPWSYTGRVALLAGRGVYSATESFVSALRELPNVTVIGDTTGGSSGGPQPVVLGGGWRALIPRTMYRTADFRIVEGQGIPPDRYVPFWVVGPLRDTILEHARGWIACPTC